MKSKKKIILGENVTKPEIIKNRFRKSSTDKNIKDLDIQYNEFEEDEDLSMFKRLRKLTIKDSIIFGLNLPKVDILDIKDTIINKPLVIQNVKTLHLNNVTINEDITISCDRAIITNTNLSSVDIIILNEVRSLTMDKISGAPIELPPNKYIKEISISNSELILDIYQFPSLESLDIKNCDYYISNNNFVINKLHIEGDIDQSLISSVFLVDSKINNVRLINKSEEFLNLEILRDIKELSLKGNIEYVRFDPSLEKIEILDCYIKSFDINGELRAEDITVKNTQDLYYLLVNRATKKITLEELRVDIERLFKSRIKELSLRNCDIVYYNSLDTLEKLIIKNSNFADSILSNGIKYLSLENCGIDDIEPIVKLINLEELYFSYNRISIIPDSIKCFKLEILDISNNINLRYITRNINRLTRLRVLDIDNNYNLRSIPDELMQLENLETINMENCNNLVLSEELRHWIEKKTSTVHYQSHIDNINIFYFFARMVNPRRKYNNITNFINQDITFGIRDKLTMFNSLKYETVYDLENVNYRDDFDTYFFINFNEEDFKFINDKEQLREIMKEETFGNMEIFFGSMIQMITLPTVVHRYIFLSNPYNRNKYLMEGNIFVTKFINKAKNSINEIISNKEYDSKIKVRIIMNIIYSWYN